MIFFLKKKKINFILWDTRELDFHFFKFFYSYLFNFMKEMRYHRFPSFRCMTHGKNYKSWVSASIFLWKFQRDNYNATGCYNLFCSGLIQVNNEIALGAAINSISHDGGSQYANTLLVWKVKSKFKWFLYENIYRKQQRMSTTSLLVLI